MTGQPVRLGGTNSAGCWDVRSVEHTLHGLGESFSTGLDGSLDARTRLPF